jgi:hypothetical protein
MSSAARGFDDVQFSNSLKLKVGRKNANRLFGLKIEPRFYSYGCGLRSLNSKEEADESNRDAQIRRPRSLAIC